MPTKPAGARTGQNGYVWTFSTPTDRYFLRRGRGKGVVDEVLGEEFAGVLVSDFYAAYHHYDGPKQRCWAHLLRDVHDLRVLYPKDDRLSRWAGAVHRLYRQAVAFAHPPEKQPDKQLDKQSDKQRRTAQLALERRLLALCRPFLDDSLAVQARLCRRVERHIKELFVFVAQPEVPPDNNAAERSLRPLGDQPQDKRRHARGAGHRHQDDAGFPFRHLARPGTKLPPGLPRTPRFPSSLNSYLSNTRVFSKSGRHSRAGGNPAPRYQYLWTPAKAE